METCPRCDRIHRGAWGAYCARCATLSYRAQAAAVEARYERTALALERTAAAVEPARAAWYRVAADTCREIGRRA